MRPDPFYDPGDDGQEPDSYPPDGELPDGPDDEPAQQGLFLCLPAGSLDTDQFTQSGPAASMPPDPLLATVIDTVTGEDGKGLPGLSDDQLVGALALSCPAARARTRRGRRCAPRGCRACGA